MTDVLTSPAKNTPQRRRLPKDLLNFESRTLDPSQSKSRVLIWRISNSDLDDGSQEQKSTRAQFSFITSLVREGTSSLVTRYYEYCTCNEESLPKDYCANLWYRSSGAWHNSQMKVRYGIMIGYQGLECGCCLCVLYSQLNPSSCSSSKVVIIRTLCLNCTR